MELLSEGPYVGKVANNHLVIINGIDCYFSYQTLVAVRVNETLTVRKNIWGPATGKHLNAIDGGDKASRVNGYHFKELVSKINL